MRFQGKNVMVTGGASGIGRATAIEFAREGAAVLIADVDEQGAGTTAAAVRELGGTAHVRQLDISDEAAVTALFAELGRLFAPLDILANCAGIADDGKPIAESELATLRRVMATNVEGLYLCMRAAIRTMKAQGHGTIVNVASQMAHEAMPNVSAYAASKHAAWSLTKTAALEVARDNIQINAISPGLVATEMMERFFSDKPAELAALLDTIPTGRMLRPEEVARNILFLASPDAAQFLGQSLRLDAGGADVKPSTLWTYPERATTGDA